MRWFDKAPLEQQLIGLEPLWAEVNGRTVLDVGCAEGLIALECKKAGAKLILGVDNRETAVKEARQHFGDSYTCDAIVADVSQWEPRASFDVVLMLGVLQKLPNPGEVFVRMLCRCKELAVVRLPDGGWPGLTDSRSGNQRIELDKAAALAGFELERVTQGPHGQWAGWLRAM